MIGASTKPPNLIQLLMSVSTRLTALALACCVHFANAQQAVVEDTVDNPFFLRMCKLPPGYMRGTFEISSSSSVNRERKKLLDVTGELGYQYFNRDGASNEVMLIQSTSQQIWGRLQIVYKETYPYTVQFRYNHTTPFQLDNQYELGLGFDREQFRRMMYEKMQHKVHTDIKKRYEDLRQQYVNAFKQYQQMRQRISGLSQAQRAVEEKIRQRTKAEGVLAGLDIKKPSLPQNNLPAMPSLDMQGWSGMLQDTLLQKAGIPALREQLLRDPLQLDSMRQVVAGLEKKINSLKAEQSRRIDSLGREMASRKPMDWLRKNKKDIPTDSTDIPDVPAPFWTRASIRLGKYLVQMSELTVSNIFLHGAGIRYGDRYFVEVTGGAYDFAFNRLFSFRPDTQLRNRPYLLAMRVGRDDGVNMDAVSFYYGTRRNLTGLVNGPAFKTIAGVSVEKRMEWSPNLRLALEVAKSTPRGLLVTEEDNKGLKDLFTRFSGKTLGAYGNLQSSFPEQRLDVEASYRYWGVQFESFNAAQQFNPQNVAQLRVGKAFWNRRLQVNSGLKYTNFKTAGIASNLKSNTLFASLSTVLRLRKLPVISLGYYPGSQLYWLEDKRLYEYHYYILNATVSHYFTAGTTPMQLTASYNRFSNRYTDSVVTAAQSFYSLFYTTWKGRFSFSVNASRQETLVKRLLTLEGGSSYATRWFRLSAAAKWNQVPGVVRWGYSFSAGLLLGKLGTISILTDRSFLPDRTGQFIPVRMGQIQYTKPLNFSVWR